MSEIPDFLLEMSKQINTQDNRITADPIWMVCYDKEYPTSEDYGEYYQWCDCENEHHVIYCSKTNNYQDDSEAVQEYLKEHYENWYNENLLDEEEEEVLDVDLHDIPGHIEKIWLNTRQEVVKACLTEADANWFIKRKQHDYPKLYTYVFSMCYCPQMIELRNWISSLTKV